MGRDKSIGVGTGGEGGVIMSTSTSTQFLTRKQENIKEEDKTYINREEHGKQANI